MGGAPCVRRRDRMHKKTTMTAREWQTYKRTQWYDSISTISKNVYSLSMFGGRIVLRVTVIG